jgi:hypothetical protein
MHGSAAHWLCDLGQLMCSVSLSPHPQNDSLPKSLCKYFCENKVKNVHMHNTYTNTHMGTFSVISILTCEVERVLKLPPTQCSIMPSVLFIHLSVFAFYLFMHLLFMPYPMPHSTNFIIPGILASLCFAPGYSPRSNNISWDDRWLKNFIECITELMTTVYVNNIIILYKGIFSL